MNDKGRHRKIVIFLTIMLIACALISLFLGRYSMSPVDVVRTLLHSLGFDIEHDPMMDSVLYAIRIPRVASAAVIGAMLALAGCVYQGVFQNPLVSPDILGVSQGAGMGAALAIMLGIGLASVQLFAFLGGLLAVFLTTMLPKVMKNDSNLMLVLSGIIVQGFMCSILSVMKFMADAETELSAIVFWQMGSVADVSYPQLTMISVVFVVCSIFMLLASWRLNILSFGDTEAKSLGVNVKAVRALFLLGASLLTASAVSVSGTIGWVGLIIPHASRLIVGSDNTKLIPVTMLVGGIFMMIIDTLSRVLTTVSIPLSVLTGLVGAPFYAWLLYKQKAKVSQ